MTARLHPHRARAVAEVSAALAADPSLTLIAAARLAEAGGVEASADTIATWYRASRAGHSEPTAEAPPDVAAEPDPVPQPLPPVLDVRVSLRCEALLAWAREQPGHWPAARARQALRLTDQAVRSALVHLVSSGELVRRAPECQGLAPTYSVPQP